MFVRQAGNGEWYVFKDRKRGNGEFPTNVLFIKSSGKSKARLMIRSISFPKEFFGKKIRMKIEIINENE